MDDITMIMKEIEAFLEERQAHLMADINRLEEEILKGMNEEARS